MKITRDELHLLIDLIPESEFSTAKRFLEFLKDNGKKSKFNEDDLFNKRKGEENFENEKEKIAAVKSWQDYLDGKCKSLDQVIKEQLYVEAE